MPPTPRYIEQCAIFKDSFPYGILIGHIRRMVFHDVFCEWMEPGGNIVSVTQQGNSVTMRFPLLAQWGTPPTLTGTIQPSPDPGYLAVVHVASGQMSAQFHLVDANRMEGTVSYGGKSTPAVLFRRR